MCDLVGKDVLFPCIAVNQSWLCNCGGQSRLGWICHCALRHVLVCPMNRTEPGTALRLTMDSVTTCGGLSCTTPFVYMALQVGRGWYASLERRYNDHEVRSTISYICTDKITYEGRGPYISFDHSQQCPFTKFNGFSLTQNTPLSPLHAHQKSTKPMHNGHTSLTRPARDLHT